MEQSWIENPAGLFTKENWYKFVPTSGMDIPTSMNAITRFAIYASVILYLVQGIVYYLVAIPLVLFLTFSVMKLFPEARTLEAFADKVSAKLKEYTYPSAKNPFMNPLLTDILDNPNRHPSAPVTNTDVKRQIENAFKHTTDLYMDTSDKFDLAQSMRTFHTIQSGLIPNDQDGFLKFLSKDEDAPDHSSAFPSRRAKEKSEGYVSAIGAMAGLPNSTDKPAGVTPAGAA